MRAKVDELLNDGMLQYGQIKTLRDELKRKTGVSFQTEGTLFFNFQSINRSFDMYVVGNIDDVELKIKAYYSKDLNKSHLVMIDDETYEIVTLDPDKARKYVFIFLKKWVDK